MFDTIEDAEIELPVAPIAEDTQTQLEQYPPLKRENYENFKIDLLKWLLRNGKSPSKGNGYAKQTVVNTHYMIDHAYRWKWERDSITTDFTPEDADALKRVLTRQTTKPEIYIAKYQKALKRLFKYFNEVKGRDYDWNPEYLDDSTNNSLSHNYFKKYELGRLYEAAIEISSFKSYNNKQMTPEERDRLKTHLSHRLGKKKSKIGPQDFKDANSWKIPSLVSVCCDAGLRPIEVKRSKVGWINFHDNELVMPEKESSKGNSMWEVALSSESVNALQRWLDERGSIEKYDGSDSIWLTKYANPYTTGPLNDLLNKLIEVGNIEERNRHLTWYAIRRGVATLWANEEGIHNAMEQLRHKDIETTELYVNEGVIERFTCPLYSDLREE